MLRSRAGDHLTNNAATNNPRHDSLQPIDNTIQHNTKHTIILIVNGQLIALRRYNYKNMIKLKFRLYLPKNTVAYDKH